MPYSKILLSERALGHTISHQLMKNLLYLLFAILLLASCDQEDDLPKSEGCNGATCAPAVSAGETAASVPASAVGIYRCVVTFAEPTSPFPIGTKATFEITSDQKLIVKIEGDECLTISNPIWRFGANASSGNYTWKDNCRDNVAFNVSFAGTSFNEVNMEPVSGTGFFGQFTLE